MAGKPKIQFNWLDRTLPKKLDGAQLKASRYMAKATEMESFRTQAYARKKAKWKDRSGNARSGLTTTWEARLTSTGGEFSVDLFHTEKYGYFLEVVNFSKKGKLAIINPTLTIRGSAFMETSLTIMFRIFGK